MSGVFFCVQSINPRGRFQTVPAGVTAVFSPEKGQAVDKKTTVPEILAKAEEQTRRLQQAGWGKEDFVAALEQFLDHPELPLNTSPMFSCPDCQQQSPFHIWVAASGKKLMDMGKMNCPKCAGQNLEMATIKGNPDEIETFLNKFPQPPTQGEYP